MHRIREWRLHIGAHKTATTHLQDTLAARRDALVAAGVDFIPRETFRPLKGPPTGRRGWRRRLLGGLPLRWGFEAKLAPHRRGPTVMVLSEENLSGLSPDLLRAPFYPDLEARLGWLHALTLPGARLHLFLSIRSLETLAPSAYAQALRAGNLPGGFTPIAAALSADPPRWSDLVGRVRALAPRASLTVWRFEDYIRDPAAITSRLLGIPLPPGEAVAPSARTRTPSAAAVARIEALGTGLPYRAHLAAAERILADDPPGAERFSPLAPDQRRRLAEADAEDLARLERRFPGVLFRPEEEPKVSLS